MAVITIVLIIIMMGLIESSIEPRVEIEVLGNGEIFIYKFYRYSMLKGQHELFLEYKKKNGMLYCGNTTTSKAISVVEQCGFDPKGNFYVLTPGKHIERISPEKEIKELAGKYRRLVLGDTLLLEAVITEKGRKIKISSFFQN